VVTAEEGIVPLLIYFVFHVKQEYLEQLSGTWGSTARIQQSLPGDSTQEREIRLTRQEAVQQWTWCVTGRRYHPKAGSCWLLKLLWYSYCILHSSTSSKVTHTCLGTKLSISLPLPFQRSPDETTTNHLPSASDLLSSKRSTKAGTAGLLPEPPPPPPPMCPCPQFTSASLFHYPAGWGSRRGSTVSN